MPPENESARKNDELILTEIGHLKDAIAEVKSSVSRLFGKIDEIFAKWNRLDKAFEVCRNNGDNTTSTVNREIENIKHSIISNYQDLSERIGKADPETIEKKADEALERKKRRFDFAVGVVKMAAWILISIASLSAAAGILFYKKGIIDINDKGNIIITSTNAGGK